MTEDRFPTRQLIGFFVPFVGFAALLAGVTWYALESGPVGVIRTFPADAPPRETRIWFAKQGHDFLVEAATPERRWYRDLLDDPRAEFLVEGEVTETSVIIMPNPGGHFWVRGMLQHKYGWADVWVALFQDTSRSIGIRLRPPRADGRDAVSVQQPRSG